MSPYFDFPLAAAASSSRFALPRSHSTMKSMNSQLSVKKTKGCFSSKARFSAVTHTFLSSSKKIVTAHLVHGVCPARLAAFFSEERGCAALPHSAKQAPPLSSGHVSVLVCGPVGLGSAV